MPKGMIRLSAQLLLAISLTVMAGCSEKKPEPAKPAPPPATPAQPTATVSSPEKVKEAVDLINATVTNARKWKAGGHNYTDLTEARALADGVVAKPLTNEKGGMVTPWGGPATIGPVPGSDGFLVLFSSVPKPDCVQLFTQMKGAFTVYAGAWGSQPKSEEEAQGLCEAGNMWFIPK